MKLKRLIIFVFIGFLAQLIDGSLVMAYGGTSNSLLLAFGVTPIAASLSVHLAEVVTTAASGISHIKFGKWLKQKQQTHCIHYIDQCPYFC
jgi:uncharacterized membrane protein YfcA